MATNGAAETKNTEERREVRTETHKVVVEPDGDDGGMICQALLLAIVAVALYYVVAEL